jgi:hypothetical protein
MVAAVAVSEKQQAVDRRFTPPNCHDAVHRPGKARKASSGKDKGAQPRKAQHMSRISTAAYKH